MSSAASESTQLQNALSSPNHGQTSLNVQSHVTGTGTSPLNTSDPNVTSQDSSTINVSSVDSIQQHVQMEETHVDDVRTHSGELGTANLAGQLTGTCTNDVISAENSAKTNKPSDGVAAQSIKPSVLVEVCSLRDGAEQQSHPPGVAVILVNPLIPLLSAKAKKLRGAYWFHFWSLLQREEDRPILQDMGRRLETSVMEIFTNHG